MSVAPSRIDVHQHILPPFYRDAVTEAGIAKASGRALPEWNPEAALGLMSLLGTATAIVSVSTPGTAFLDTPSEAAALARRLNDYAAGLAADHPGRFGYFATLPLPDTAAATQEATRALDDNTADGVVLLANNRGSYLGSDGQDELWQCLDERRAVAFIHPAELPAPPIDGIPSFATDFLLDTTRAAYLLVRNGVVRRYPNIRFILSHAGGFVPYASHRMAITIAGETSRSLLDVLDDFRGFYFDTALSSSPAALPSLRAFARPGHILFGSDWPFAPTVAAQYFASGLDNALGPADLAAVNRSNALALLPRLATAPATPPAEAAPTRLRHTAQRTAARLVFKLVQPRTNGDA